MIFLVDHHVGKHHTQFFGSGLAGRRWACVFLLFAVVAGCGRSGDFLNENDRLRSENLILTRQVEELESALQSRSAQVQTLEKQLGHVAAVSGVSPEDLPRVVEVRLGRLSGAVDRDKDGIDDTVRLYVLTLDQRGRFMPAIGPASVQLVVLTPGEPPVVVNEKDYTPKQFEKAYRSGFTGSHYSLEIELGAGMPHDVAEVNAKVIFTDAATGAEHGCERGVKVRRVVSVSRP